MLVEQQNNLPTRHMYGPGDALTDLPEGVRLSTPVGPWWTVVAMDETWNHIIWSKTQWHSEPQTCRTCQTTCTPVVSLVFSATMSLYWCAEHRADADAFDDLDVCRCDGGPGWWVPVPDGKTRLICCNLGGPRHPEFEKLTFDSPEAAMRFAWEQNLLGLIVLPDLVGRYDRLYRHHD